MEHSQNVPECSLYQVSVILKHSRSPVHPFIRNIANRQTETDKLTDVKTLSSPFGEVNYCLGLNDTKIDCSSFIWVPFTYNVTWDYHLMPLWIGRLRSSSTSTMSKLLSDPNNPATTMIDVSNLLDHVKLSVIEAFTDDGILKKVKAVIAPLLLPLKEAINTANDEIKSLKSQVAD